MKALFGLLFLPFLLIGGLFSGVFRLFGWLFHCVLGVLGSLFTLILSIGFVLGGIALCATILGAIFGVPLVLLGGAMIFGCARL